MSQSMSVFWLELTGLFRQLFAVEEQTPCVFLKVTKEKAERLSVSAMARKNHLLTNTFLILVGLYGLTKVERVMLQEL